MNRLNSYPLSREKKNGEKTLKKLARANTCASTTSDLILKNGSNIQLLSDPNSNAIASPVISINELLNIYMTDSPSPTGPPIDAIQSPLTPSDFVSPVPKIAFSPKASFENSCLIQRERILEELIESETNYVNSLQLLLNFYITPLSNAKSCSIMFTLVKSSIGVLQVNHNKLLRFLHSVADDVSIKKNSSIAAAAFASGICEYGIDTYVYEEYISEYADITRLINSKHAENSTASYLALQTQIISGSETYLQHTQPSTMHMDLSFFSLMQRPVSRISKYRLIVELLLNNTFEIDQNYYCVQNCLNVIKAKLNTVNKSLMKIKELNVSNHIHTLVEGLDRPIEYFGKLNLSGSLLCIWVEGGEVKSSWASILCFKSYILISSVTLNENQTTCTNTFIIPLNSCSVSKDYINSANFGGLVSDYPLSLKLQFENSYCKYELLLASIIELEYLIWKEHLESYIFLNGENKFDYSYSRNNQHDVFKCPSNLNPYDIHLSKYDCENLRLCYFLEVIPVEITKSNGKGLRQSECVSIELKFRDRLRVEELLQAIWTVSLPLLGTKAISQNESRKHAAWRWKIRAL
ncbi:hypothetical protein CLIB1423_25S01090 [[Candida] railenensis]|uniref:DH domain-containing protein n=1 Tax=[Candida] railenensis TaxID=45579 RepID=A0A9P0QTJ6_9ASCO|nr:hypothetical protein CLIB1423_25S01090 [[Candida] railenensis]